jgi:hypothetical protein
LEIITSVSFGHGFVLVCKVFNFLLQESDFPGALLLQSVKLVPQLDILHDLLANLAVFLLQLVRSIFNRSEFVRFDSGAVGHGLCNRKSSQHSNKPVNKRLIILAQGTYSSKLVQVFEAVLELFQVLPISMGSSTSSVGMAYRAFGGTTSMPPMQVPTLPWSSGVGRCCRVPITSSTVRIHASGRQAPAGGGGSMGSPEGISGFSSSVSGLSPSICSPLASCACTLNEVGAGVSPRTDNSTAVVAPGQVSNVQHLVPSQARGLDFPQQCQVAPSLDQRVAYVQQQQRKWSYMNLQLAKERYSDTYRADFFTANFFFL